MIRILVHFPLASVMLAMLAGSGDFNTLNRPTSNLSVDEEMWPFTQAEWKIISVSKQKTRDEAIDKAANSLPKSAEPGPDNEYLSASASEIVKNIAEGKWLAAEVTAAYIRRAAEVQRHHNPITEVLFADAIAQARALDEEFKRTGQLKGPLHGIPFSIKDLFDITGYDSSIGFSPWCNKPKSTDAALVRMVKEAGGVIICKTNVPQTMLNFECSNPVWGVTTNPWATRYTCGGSSGGEAVMLASDASALGVGSDVGGSLRIPALYCGVYSLKPTTGRVSKQGISVPNPGFDTIKSTPGPISRCVQDVELLSRLMFSATPCNDYEGVPPVPYRDVTLPPKLRIGYYFEDHFLKTSPVNIRAVQETVNALKAAGHELVEFDFPFGLRSLQLFAGITSADGYRTLQAPRGSDPKEKNLFLITLGPSLPRFIHIFAVWFIKNILRDPVFADGFARSKHKTLTEYWKDIADMKTMTKEFYEQVWDKYKLDAIIAPGMACPALPHGTTRELSPLANGTFYYNVVESPVGVVPVTRVDPSKDKISAGWDQECTACGGSWILNRRVYQGVYNPDMMKGLPVGVQVVGRHWEDEKVVAVMDIVDKALGPRGFGPGSWQGPPPRDVEP